MERSDNNNNLTHKTYHYIPGTLYAHMNSSYNNNAYVQMQYAVKTRYNVSLEHACDLSAGAGASVSASSAGMVGNASEPLERSTHTTHEQEHARSPFPFSGPWGPNRFSDRSIMIDFWNYRRWLLLGIFSFSSWRENVFDKLGLHTCPMRRTCAFTRVTTRHDTR